VLLAQNEQTRSDLPAFVNLFKARSVGSNMFVGQGMTRLMVMAVEDRCGRFVALAITANFLWRLTAIYIFWPMALKIVISSFMVMAVVMADRRRRS
jgi:hypothetical protein